MFCGTTVKYPDHYPVWSHQVTQDYPSQGVRVPYQEYLRNGHQYERILCRFPVRAMKAFPFVAEHVSDDIAVSVLERVIQSIERVKADGVVLGDWDTPLRWLNDVLAEVWTGRGAFPGLGSVLQYLGFDRGTTFHREILYPLSKRSENPWEFVRAILDGRQEPTTGLYRQGLLRARDKWPKIKNRHEQLSSLIHFELTPAQVERIVNKDLRAQSGINLKDSEIIENPYLLYEMDQGAWINETWSDPIGLETVDHSLLPEGDVALCRQEERIAHDDPRRVRAVAQAVLREASDGVDTVLPLTEMTTRITARFPERRPCRPDSELFLADREFHETFLWIGSPEGEDSKDLQLVSLKWLRQLEQDFAASLDRLAKKTHPNQKMAINWAKALAQNFGEPRTERERAALEEKERALRTLIDRRLSVLAGSAGTGKTCILKVSLNQLERLKGKHPVELLAPTGKARVRLSTKTGRNAKTIHQFLLKTAWLDPTTFNLRLSGGNQVSPSTVIIDECSMIPMDLFGVLWRALDQNALKRVILVGDPNQLPPIGPGRPFVDLIEHLKDKYPGCLVLVSICMRTADDDKGASESGALAFADGYRTDAPGAADNEILAAIARGESKNDLSVAFWKTPEELNQLLKAKMREFLGVTDKDYAAFNKSLGIDQEDWTKSECWQILASARAHYFGTDDITRNIQLEYRGGLIRRAKSVPPRPFGNLEIVWTEKVTQVKNCSKKAKPASDENLDYVANGEISVVRSSREGTHGDHLGVTFSTQPGVTYLYSRGSVDENLELAYSLTVHKAQGSDFDIVFLIIPHAAATLSRELLHTGLTRFRKRLVLLIEKDTSTLQRLRKPDTSATRLRDTQLFRLTLRPEGVKKPHLEAPIHRTKRDIAVRSKSEAIVVDTLDSLDRSSPNN